MTISRPTMGAPNNPLNVDLLFSILIAGGIVSSIALIALASRFDATLFTSISALISALYAGTKITVVQIIALSRLVRGLIFYISFYLYLFFYIRDIWNPLFLIEKDRGIFYLYLIFWILLYCTLIIWPIQWYLGVLFVFIIFALYKRSRYKLHKKRLEDIGFTFRDWEVKSQPLEMNAQEGSRNITVNYLARFIYRSFIGVGFIYADLS